MAVARASVPSSTPTTVATLLGGKAMARKVMISCAVTGSADTPGKNPAVPVTPAQIAASAVDAGLAARDQAPQLFQLRHGRVRDPRQALKPFAQLRLPRIGLCLSERAHAPRALAVLASSFPSRVRSHSRADGREASLAHAAAR